MTEINYPSQIGSEGTHLPRRTIDNAVDGERDFVITPSRRQFFVRTGRQVIAACNTQMRIERWLEVYNAMLGHVRDFALENQDALSACYATPRNAKTLLAFVPLSESFNFALSPKLAELQFSLLELFPLLGTIEVGQVPGWDLDRFVELDHAEKLYPLHQIESESVDEAASI